MDMRTCRNGHTVPVLYRKWDGVLRCPDCEADRNRRYIANRSPEQAERRRAAKRERHQRMMQAKAMAEAGWV